MTGELLVIEILVDIFCWISYGIFKKQYKDADDKNPAKQTYENVYIISVIIAIVDLLIIALTLSFS